MEAVPVTRVQKTTELEKLVARAKADPERVIQQNFIQVQHQIGDVTVQGARNLTIGGTQDIGNPGSSQGRQQLDTWTEKLRRKTLLRLEEWTRGMVKTSALEKVMEKLNSGMPWTTIKGSPGEGKTTVAYMALQELHNTGRHVFQVTSPQEFSQVIMSCSQPVIMLDDIFGNLEFDRTKWVEWEQCLHHILSGREHRSHETCVTPAKEEQVTVILVMRDYVLNSASFNMGRMHDYVNHSLHVVSMANTMHRNNQEKQAIWGAVSKFSGVKLDSITVETICRIRVPHGFPHVCRLFVTLRQLNPQLSAEKFFRSPLEFLNQTIRKFMRDRIKLTLFMEMIKRDGKLHFHELGKLENYHDIVEVADDLVGSYLRKENSIFTYHHPSIYDSIAYNLCNNYTLFVIQNCSLSFIHERLRLEPTQDNQHDLPRGESGLVVQIPRRFIGDLAKRFAEEISKQRFFEVLSHQALTEEVFVTELMTQSAVSIPEVLPLRDKDTDETFLSLVASNKSPWLLKLIDNQPDIQLTQKQVDTVLYGVCRYAASEVLAYLILTREELDINARYGAQERTPLMSAAETKDCQFVHQVMSLNPDVNASTADSKTVLHFLCENGLLSAVLKAIAEVTDIDAKDEAGCSALGYACRGNHVEVVKLLLNRGARIDAGAALIACGRGNMDVVTLLFEKGASWSMTTSFYSLMHSACRGANVDVIRLLVEKGASVNTTDGFGRSPLNVSCFYNKPKSVQCLLELGANTNCKGDDGVTPLHTAARCGSKECVSVLLKAGMDVNVKGTDNDTALHAATGRRAKDCVDLLLKAGANVNSENALGDTALHLAAERGAKECMEVLLKAGADVNIHNIHGDTPLHSAAGSGSYRCVGMLLKAGADVNASCYQGQTPLHKAVYCKLQHDICLPDVSVCQILVTNGASVNEKDAEGNTPLHLLCRVACHTEVAKDWPRRPASAYENVYRKLVILLVKHGADVKICNHRQESAIRGWCQSLVQARNIYFDNELG